jgi:hypothetical protein
MPHKKKILKPLQNSDDPQCPSQHQVLKALETEKKVKPQKVFEGYKTTKKNQAKKKKS